MAELLLTGDATHGRNLYHAIPSRRLRGPCPTPASVEIPGIRTTWVCESGNEEHPRVEAVRARTSGEGFCETSRRPERSDTNATAPRERVVDGLVDRNPRRRCSGDGTGLRGDRGGLPRFLFSVWHRRQQPADRRKAREQALVERWVLVGRSVEYGGPKIPLLKCTGLLA